MQPGSRQPSPAARAFGVAATGVLFSPLAAAGLGLAWRLFGWAAGWGW